jgi:hypothetical protein
MNVTKNKVIRVLAPVVLIVCLVLGAVIGATLFRPQTSSPQQDTATSTKTATNHHRNGPSHSTAQSVISSLEGAGKSEKLKPGSSLVATATSNSVPLFKRPGAGHPYKTVKELPASYGAPLVFLVDSQKKKWLHVYLPIRANNMTLSTTAFSIKVNLRAHRLSVFRGDSKVMTKPVGVGKSVTPTPAGKYYLVYLLRPTMPNSVFGKYAFGTSAYSNVFTSFAGGDGEVGLHGTNEPGTIGSDVSHGCLRLKNAVITRITRLVPLGTPLTIAR